MTGVEIRDKFLKFFADHDHAICKSSSLIPANDPTLLFTNAGMVQFKDIFTGQIKKEYSRATTCQKCMRAGGKHNDLENVGYTARHHTFFEMLGNFSFGNYFKKEAIAFAWKFLIEYMQLPKEKLWITVFKEDDEAEKLWGQVANIGKERIVRMGEKDNFWAMGDVGPCGPCSEIHIDQGPSFGCGKPDCEVGCDCDRYLELWNLVFMQYEKHQDGSVTPLPKPSIDTGMGLERIAAVAQQVRTNYDSDIFSNIINQLETITKKRYKDNQKDDIYIRVISDHIRAITFLLADGVLPSNEGRGYVLRRIIRRAGRCGKQLGMDSVFLHELVSTVIFDMKDAYPEISDLLSYISTTIKYEEERFLNTLNRGMIILNEIIEKSSQESKNIISGKEIFKLYDTFGFPPDLAADILRDYEMQFDRDEFNENLNDQKNRARLQWKGSGENAISSIYKDIAHKILAIKFIGYTDNLEKIKDTRSKVLAIIHNGENTDKATLGDTVEIILDQTPFYGERGGQIGDRGEMSGVGNSPFYGIVLDTQLPFLELITHKVQIKRGSICVGMDVKPTIDLSMRNNISCNHTATHLLHAALREVLGEHVKQSGSVVSDKRLRFDFTHFEPLGFKERMQIEQIVNQKIRENLPLSTKTMDIEQALKTTVLALFSEKYGSRVRVVTVDDFSAELCGGTHIERTGNIGLFLITEESSIAQGVRRIEAICGETAFLYLNHLREQSRKISSLLKSQGSENVSKVEKLLIEVKERIKQNEQLQNEIAIYKISDIIKSKSKYIENTDITYITYNLKGQNIDHNRLRQMADLFLDKMNKKGIVIIGADVAGKAALVVKVSRDISSRISASKIIKPFAEILKGKGGGRPDMAQAGGSSPDLINKALDASDKILCKIITETDAKN